MIRRHHPKYHCQNCGERLIVRPCLNCRDRNASDVSVLKVP